MPRGTWQFIAARPVRHHLRQVCAPGRGPPAQRWGCVLIVSDIYQGGEGSPEESRRGLIGRPEGRPRPERVLKDARAPSSFRTDPAAEAGFSPCDYRSQPVNDLLVW